jgi:NAD dependent epimerase/dehydratase family enzyme
MSVIHLEDCAAQLVNLAENGQKNQNLNIFSGSPVSQKDFAEMIAMRLNTEVEAIPVAELMKKYGQTVADALTSSIPMSTIFPEISSSYSFRYPDVASMLESMVSFFENKQAVLTKSS